MYIKTLLIYKYFNLKIQHNKIEIAHFEFSHLEVYLLQERIEEIHLFEKLHKLPNAIFKKKNKLKTEDQKQPILLLGIISIELKQAFTMGLRKSDKGFFLILLNKQR